MDNVSLIVAHDLNGAIGYQNTLQWHMPSDLAIFRRETLNKAVLMGRRTAESVGRALPKRTNFVLTRQETAPYKGQIPVRSIEDAIVAAEAMGLELVICGGEQVYTLALPRVKKLHVSVIDITLTNADAWFPFTGDGLRDFELTHREVPPRAEQDDFGFVYEIWERK